MTEQTTPLRPDTHAGSDEDSDALTTMLTRLERLDHALRTPLGTLMNGLELIRLAPDAATRTQAAAMMERQVRQMMTQLGELRDITQGLRGLQSPS